MPDAKIVVIRRPLAEVQVSFARFGLIAPQGELEQRDLLLEEVSRLPGVLTFSFADLSGEAACKAIFEHCLDKSFDRDWWEYQSRFNIQVDMAKQVQLLQTKAGQIKTLRQEVARKLLDLAEASDKVEFREELWPSIASEVLALAELHSDEVDFGIEPRRKFLLDQELMMRASLLRYIRIYTARLRGRLIGYCTWNLSTDVESKGLPIATQGAWFTHPDFVGNGTALFEYSLSELKRIGIQCVFPHHRTQGRGSPERLAVYFRRLGATQHQTDYTLWIGD